MNSLLDWLNSSLKHSESDVFKDVVSVEEAEPEAMADGQLVIISDIKRITLTLVTSSGEKKKVKTILKKEAATKKGRDVADMCQAFPTEIMMYGDVLKTMERMMLDIGDNDFIWPQCYHYGENKLLFQDLCEVGYKVVPTHHFLDLDHSLLVMKGIGKFHGLSLALKQGSIFESSLFAKPYYARNLPFMDQMFLKTIEALAQSIHDWGPEWSSVPERLMKYLEKPGEILCNVWESSKDKWTVLNHGDFSMRNMLFHYNPASSKPDAIKFVDFQMCHYSNLGNDLATLLFSSVRPSLRNEHLKLLLEIYVESLSTTSRAHGYKGAVPTVEDVESSLRDLAPLTIVTFALNIPTFVTSGKVNLQEKTDEFLNKYDNIDEALSNQDQTMSHLLFSDEEVKSMLQLEIKRCLNENIF